MTDSNLQRILSDLKAGDFLKIILNNNILVARIISESHLQLYRTLTDTELESELEISNSSVLLESHEVLTMEANAIVSKDEVIYVDVAFVLTSASIKKFAIKSLVGMMNIYRLSDHDFPESTQVDTHIFPSPMVESIFSGVRLIQKTSEICLNNVSHSQSPRRTQKIVILGYQWDYFKHKLGEVVQRQGGRTKRYMTRSLSKGIVSYAVVKEEIVLNSHEMLKKGKDLFGCNFGIGTSMKYPTKNQGVQRITIGEFNPINVICISNGDFVKFQYIVENQELHVTFKYSRMLLREYQQRLLSNTL